MPRTLTARTTALALSGLIALAAAVPASAAAPGAGPIPTPTASLGHLRPDRNAWDTQGADASTRVIVRFTPATSAVARRLTTSRLGLTRISDDPGQRLTVVIGASRATIARLEADPTVERVSVDHRRFRDTDPTQEPAWVELWGMDNTGQRIYQDTPGTEGTPNVDIDGSQALGVTTGDPSVVVAVIDDGVDFSHPDLAARAWTNPGESGGGKETDGIDNDGNGYIDDVHGWDFCHNDNTVHDFDDDFHGTHVSGTIAASLDGVGVVGVAPSVSIMALKFLGNDPACGFDSQAIAAIAYAKSFGVHLANASWGGRGNQADAPELYDAIANSNMLFVASAGNSGIDNDTDPLPSLPATFDLPNIVSVAAIDNQGFIAGFSNVGATTVDIAAPGVGILSSLPADSTYPTPGWGWLDGTSMAAPHVTGAAALVLSTAPALGTDLPALKARILGSAKAMPNTDGLTLTGASVDAFRALDIVPPVGATPIYVGFVIGSTLGASSLTARVSWPAATDDLTGIGAYGVLVRADEGAWTTQATAITARTSDRALAFSHTYAFRVRPRDGAGNWGAYLGSPSVIPTVYQETSSRATYSTRWAVSTSSHWSGGRTRTTSSKNATVSFAFTGRAFAIVAPKGPTRGTAKLYIDGFYVSTINLYRTSSIVRSVVAGRTWSTSAAHVIKLVVVGTGSHPRFDVDAFLVMR